MTVIKGIIEWIEDRIKGLSDCTCKHCKGSGYSKLPDKKGWYGVSCEYCHQTGKILIYEQEDRRTKIGELQRTLKYFQELCKKDLDELLTLNNDEVIKEFRKDLEEVVSKDG